MKPSKIVVFQALKRCGTIRLSPLDFLKLVVWNRMGVIGMNVLDVYLCVETLTVLYASS